MCANITDFIMDPNSELVKKCAVKKPPKHDIP